MTVRDISSVKKLEHDLHEHREHYRMPLELSNTYPYTANSQGEIVWGGSRGLFDYEMDQITGHSWQNLVHPDDLQSLLEHWESDVSTESPHDHTFRMCTLDGTYHWVRARATPHRDEHGQVLGWYGLLEDIDDRDPHEP